MYNVKQHNWGPVPIDGPQEEGGICVDCGAWATSEAELPCDEEIVFAIRENE